MMRLILALGILTVSCATKGKPQLGYVIVEGPNSVDVWTSDHFTVTDTAIYIMNTDTIR
jgi:hypothetical protein